MQGIRLTTGTTGSSGLLEILHDNQWGKVCGDDEWDFDDARVVCHQLGYHNATNSYKKTSIQGYEFVSMSNVQCNGNETSISSCKHERLQEGNCPIGNNAHVTCEGRIMHLTYRFFSTLKPVLLSKVASAGLRYQTVANSIDVWCNNLTKVTTILQILYNTLS
ncbi:hypothetical protein HOLleu_21326 [Holothuria leucospilota]|uniref:SRCR domain-containing protein n=1 Tax=Holothuria leucospilota TaxID=206669 RepID=A0A9Q1BW94_HOLLE|nr:hypothetical protein HOLleu_21326 [Holothuria leucospilota]